MNSYELIFVSKVRGTFLTIRGSTPPIPRVDEYVHFDGTDRLVMRVVHNPWRGTVVVHTT